MHYVILGTWEYTDQNFYGSFADREVALAYLHSLWQRDDPVWDTQLALVECDPTTGQDVFRERFEKPD